MACGNEARVENAERQLELSEDAWETDISDNREYYIETIPTRESGTEVFVNGERKSYDEIAIEYNPVINDEGHYAYISQSPKEGYQVIIDGDIVFDTNALLHYLEISEQQVIFAMSDNADNVTQLYIADIYTKQWDYIASYSEEYMEDILALSSNCFAFITSQLSMWGEKAYTLYFYDPLKDGEPRKIIEDSSNALMFPTEKNWTESGKAREQDKVFAVDQMELTDNGAYLFNAYKIVYGEERNAPFSKGNDFRGRISWSESYHIRGLTELFQKTKDDDLYEKILGSVQNVLLARNSEINMEKGEYLPDFLWCEKAYSIEGEPVSIIVNNGEILGALLHVLTEKVISQDSLMYDDIIQTAERAWEYYDAQYAEGHYFLPYGYPMPYDGTVVPWNWQNSMAEVSLDLYLLTGNKKYLERCEELIAAFKNEWIVDEERIYWHYWPLSHYQGWNGAENISKNTPILEAEDDTLYEDTSHAGISVRLLYKYYNNVPDGVISEDDIRKISNNMEYFCYEDGFSRFISGNIEYQPKAWNLPPGTWWSYMENDIYRNFIKQGSLNIYPEWDNMGRLFANAKYFDSGGETGGTVERLRICVEGGGFNISIKDSFLLDAGDIKEFVRDN